MHGTYFSEYLIMILCLLLFSDPACHPEIEHNQATFKLSLTDVFQCGVTRVHNYITVTKLPLKYVHFIRTSQPGVLENLENEIV